MPSANNPRQPSTPGDDERVLLFHIIIDGTSRSREIPVGTEVLAKERPGVSDGSLALTRAVL